MLPLTVMSLEAYIRYVRGIISRSWIGFTFAASVPLQGMAWQGKARHDFFNFTFRGNE